MSGINPNRQAGIGDILNLFQSLASGGLQGGAQDTGAGIPSNAAFTLRAPSRSFEVSALQARISTSDPSAMIQQLVSSLMQQVMGVLQGLLGQLGGQPGQIQSPQDRAQGNGNEFCPPGYAGAGNQQQIGQNPQQTLGGLQSQFGAGNCPQCCTDCVRFAQPPEFTRFKEVPIGAAHRLRDNCADTRGQVANRFTGTGAAALLKETKCEDTMKEREVALRAMQRDNSIQYDVDNKTFFRSTKEGGRENVAGLAQMAASVAPMNQKCLPANLQNALPNCKDSAAAAMATGRFTGKRAEAMLTEKNCAATTAERNAVIQALEKDPTLKYDADKKVFYNEDHCHVRYDVANLAQIQAKLGVKAAAAGGAAQAQAGAASY